MLKLKFLKAFILSVIYHFDKSLSQTYSILHYGGVGDGKTDDTHAVRAAFSAAANSNGGRVLFDAGYTFLTGCFNITSNTIVDVQGTILAVDQSSGYVPVQPLPWYGGGQDCQQCGAMEWSSVLRTYNAQNITITGGGTIDGQGKNWWGCVGDLKKAPCNGLSRPQLVRLINTVDIVIYNITLKDSPSWTLHLANTTNVHVYATNITAPSSSHNTDGVDIDCSVNVLIENSMYSGGDDAIAVKSGINYLGRTFGRTTSNVVVQNFTVGTAHGISVGSEMSGGVRNVSFRNIDMHGSSAGPRIKSERGRGGIVQDITYTNISLYDVETALYFTMNYHTNPPTNATATPQFININVNNFYAEGSKNAWYLDGLPESWINNTVFSNMNFTNSKKFTEKCDNIVGICDNSTVFPYCPGCIQAEPCVDMSNDCQQYMTQCNNPSYHTTLCSLCRKSCNLCNSC